MNDGENFALAWRLNGERYNLENLIACDPNGDVSWAVFGFGIIIPDVPRVELLGGY